MNKTFCPMPFIHAQINPGGKVLPCCKWQEDQDGNTAWPNINDGGLDQALNHKNFQKVRQDLLEGKMPGGCSKCFKQESTLGKSYRLYRLNKDKSWIDKTFDKLSKTYHSMRFIETAFSTLCNLSCRMCWPGVSSTFHKIVNPKQKKQQLYDYGLDFYNIDLSNLKEIKFVGGEPLMEQKHDDFIQHLIDNNTDIKDLELIYHTNATVLPSPRVREFWKKCKSVQLKLSIDGYDSNNWNQRPGPYTWLDVIKVCDTYKQLAKDMPNLKIRISSTITKISVFHLVELENWIQDYWKEFCDNDHLFWDAYPCVQPKQLAICDWTGNSERFSQVKKYLTQLKRKDIAMSILNEFDLNHSKNFTYDDNFNDYQTKLNNYWNYSIDKYL